MYQFTSDWFSGNAGAWADLYRKYQPRNVLEIGSHEGRSACVSAELMKDGNIVCVDVWGTEAEKAFDRNTEFAMSRSNVRISKLKGRSFVELPKLSGQSFDCIYIDGSHRLADVLADAVLSFELCKVGGLMIFDDYLWPHNAKTDDGVLDTPKAAIDAFVNCYRKRIRILPHYPATQLYVERVA